MARTGIVMHIKAGCENEYQSRHDQIWPELVDQIRNYGIRNYTIFRHELTVFVYFECEGDPMRAASDLTKRWWTTMEPLMVCNGDGSPVRARMNEVLHLQ